MANTLANTATISSEFIDYEMMLDLLYKGKYEELSVHLKSLRHSNLSLPDVSLIRKLVSFRLALISGHLMIDIDSINPHSTNNLRLRAEANIVLGLYYFNSGDFPKGQVFFGDAVNYFQASGPLDREIICTYNFLIADTYKTYLNVHSLIDQFNHLLQLATKAGYHKGLGLIYRQLSYLYKETNQFLKAMDFAELSIQFLQPDETLSDYHLAVLNLAEILLEIQESQTHHLPLMVHSKAYSIESLLKLIRPPFDQRVLLALNFIQERSATSIHSLVTQNLDLLATSCPHFLERYRRWVSKSNQIVQSQSFDLSYLEKKLLLELSKAPQSKILLIEKLWPEMALSTELDSRFHRLLSRLRKKIKTQILYDTGMYSVKA